MVVPEDVLRLANNSGFLRIDHADDWGIEEFLLSLRKIVNIYLEAEILFFPDGTFKNRPSLFAQLCSLHVYVGSTSHENYIHPVLLAI